MAAWSQSRVALGLKNKNKDGTVWNVFLYTGYVAESFQQGLMLTDSVAAHVFHSRSGTINPVVPLCSFQKRDSSCFDRSLMVGDFSGLALVALRQTHI